MVKLLSYKLRGLGDTTPSGGLLRKLFLRKGWSLCVFKRQKRKWWENYYVNHCKRGEDSEMEWVESSSLNASEG